MVTVVVVVPELMPVMPAAAVSESIVFPETVRLVPFAVEPRFIPVTELVLVIDEIMLFEMVDAPLQYVMFIAVAVFPATDQRLIVLPEIVLADPEPPSVFWIPLTVPLPAA